MENRLAESIEMPNSRKVTIEGKNIELLHFLIANAQCHLIKKSYLLEIDRNTLEFSKALQNRINKIRSGEYGKP